MDTNAQFLRYTWLSAQLVQMVTRGSWLRDWCAREAITMHRKCFTVNTLRNFKGHRVLCCCHKSGTYFCTQVSSSWIHTKIQYYITVLWECQTSTASGKFCRVCGGRVQKKGKNRRPVHQHNTHQKALLATYGIDVASDDMTHPSIQNTSVTCAMQQQGDVKAAVSIGVCALHWGLWVEEHI